MILYSEDLWRQDLKANFNRPYQRCTKTVMDTISDPSITFDEDGVCNYYHEYSQLAKANVFTGEAGKEKLETFISKIKEHGRNKKYDCITGVSGGVDSSFMMLLAKEHGLRPLVVHFDNGWNSELAVKNIENILSKLKFDLYTLVVDWNEFRDLQLSYMKAGVVDIEALTDHAIAGTLYKLADKHNIKYILSGANIATEGILPRYWISNKTDGLNIKDIHRHFGRIPLKTYPFFSTRRKLYYLFIKKIKSLYPLDLMEYNKEEVKKVIAKEVGWKDYGGKHCESVFTKFYQGYILPVKFGIDKRKAHLSSLICSGQMTREDAMHALQQPIYDPIALKTDMEFVLKKLGLNQHEFDEYLRSPRIEHTEYKHETGIWDDIPYIKIFRPAWQLVKRIKSPR